MHYDKKPKKNELPRRKRTWYQNHETILARRKRRGIEPLGDSILLLFNIHP